MKICHLPPNKALLLKAVLNQLQKQLTSRIISLIKEKIALEEEIISVAQKVLVLGLEQIPVLPTRAKNPLHTETAMTVIKRPKRKLIHAKMRQKLSINVEKKSIIKVKLINYLPK